MTTLRLVMEKYIAKNYSEDPFSYHGDISTVKKWKVGMKSNPLYSVRPYYSNEIYLLGIEPNIILKLCKISKDKIKEFERITKSSLSWFQGNGGLIFGCDDNLDDKVYSLEFVITGYTKVEHIDGDPLNHTFNNLKIQKYTDVSSEKNEMSF